MSKPRSSQANNVTMSGGGLYSLATKGAKDVIDHATPLVLKALADIELDDQGFTLTDMGCADGGTSLAMIGKVIDQLRSRSRSVPIRVIYADQPHNDFNALVHIVHGLTDFKSYLGKHDNVFPLFSGSSFYLPIVPPGSLNLGFSATAMHWLSRKPGNISSHVHAVGATGDELKAFQIQAAGDWQTILLHRAHELHAGGRLVLVNFCRDEKGRYLGNTGGVNMFDNFNRIWQRYLDDRIITAQEYQNMTLPQYYNSVEEFSAPLIDTSSAVHSAGLRLESIETRVVRCPFAVEFESHGDAAKFAKEYIPTIRTWNESIFMAALSDERPEEQRREIISGYYNEYEQQVARDPGGHAMDYVHAYITIRKEAS